MIIAKLFLNNIGIYTHLIFLNIVDAYLCKYYYIILDVSAHEFVDIIFILHDREN